MGISIKVDCQKVLKGLNNVTKVMNNDFPNKLEEVGEESLQMVVNLTPVDTGALASSWQSTGLYGRFSVRIFTNMHYSVPVEEGFMMDSHFVPTGLNEGFISPNIYISGVHMARDTSEIMGLKMNSYFKGIEQKIVGGF